MPSITLICNSLPFYYIFIIQFVYLLFYYLFFFKFLLLSIVFCFEFLSKIINIRNTINRSIVRWMLSANKYVLLAKKLHQQRAGRHWIKINLPFYGIKKKYVGMRVEIKLSLLFCIFNKKKIFLLPLFLDVYFYLLRKRLFF